MGQYRRLLIGLVGLAVLASPAGASRLENVPKQGQVALAHCGVWHNGQAGELAGDRLLYALGLLPTVDQHWRGWSAGRVDGESPEGDTFRYRVAFGEPVTVGSVLAGTQSVGRLRPEAPFPGDPANPDHWETVRLPGGTPPRLATFATVATTRSLLFTDVRQRGVSTLGPVRVYGHRLLNIAPLAGARAKAEYQAPNNFFGGVHFRAIDAARGRGSWQNTGQNKDGLITAPPISDVHGQWFILAWDEPRTLDGLYLQDNFTAFGVDFFAGPATVSPLAGIETEWRRLRDDQYQVDSQQGRWLRFAEPLTTTGLRLRISKVSTERDAPAQVARIDALLVFEQLGEAPAPNLAIAPPPPPFAIPYRAPRDGYSTLVVDDAQGRRVRNLFARTPRTAGDYRQAWDLTDEAGALVAPGQYRWKAIAGPELELHYQMSVYPNVSVHHPENSAWLNGHHGPGGWLADHAPPRTVCTAGEHLFVGAPTAESGVGFAACDLSGRKLWGIHSFAAWSGGTGMATDGTTVFVEHVGSGHYGAGDTGADRVWAVDIASRKWRTLLTAQQSERRRRGIAAMAARDGKLVLAINAVDNWLGNATGWADVDLANCRPAYAVARKPRRPYEIVPDPRDDFLRLFRLKGDPPGYGHPSGEGLIWLESERGPGSRQQLLLAFDKPIAIGSCVFPVPQNQEYTVRLSVLKPDGDYPPQPNRRDQWLRFDSHGERAWDVAVAPPNTTTRALLITFIKGEDDELADLLDGGAGGAPDLLGGGLGGLLEAKAPETGDLLGGAGAWAGRLEGMRILRRRFRNLFGEATVRVNSGQVDRHGVWQAERREPLSRANPGIYLMEWPQPQTIRGLAIQEIDGQLTEIDAYVGPATVSIPLEGDEHWEMVGQFIPRRRMDHSGFAGHNALALYLDGTVDFGREVVTRAIRLRVVSQWTTDTREGSCAKDRLGIDPTRCRIFGIAPLQALGDEAAVDDKVAQRIEIVDGQSGAIEHEIAIRQPTQLAYAPDGTLYAVAAGQVVVVDLDGGAHRPFATTVEQPGALACDRHGNLYVYDAAPAQRVIHVYRPDGALLRQIGEPGGYQAGAWNPRRFNALTAIAVDQEDKLWAVDTTYWPKRISCWTAAGEWQRDYLGPTAYGGGGVLDPGDKNRLFYGPLEFAIDWETGNSELKNLTWVGGGGTGKMFMSSPAGEVPIRIDGRLYLVTRSEFTRQNCAIVYLHQGDRLRMVAAIGRADQFAPLNRPDIAAALGAQALETLQFVWTDRDGDGEVQFEEIEFAPRRIGHLSDFAADLSIHAGATAFEVKEFLANGAPVYQARDYPLPVTSRYGDRSIFRLANGSFYRFGNGPLVPDAGFAADGSVLWTYKNEGAGVGPNRSCGPYALDQVVCQFGVVGHETAAGGELGEFFVVNTNFGVWNLWTADGLLAGRIFRDLRDGRRLSWTMPEHQRGLRLDDVTAGEEHFSGWFCRSAADGKYYVVAGHNHASIVELVGLDDFRRAGGEFQVTTADLAAIQAWNREMVSFRAREEAKVFDCYAIGAADQSRKWEVLPTARLAVGAHQAGRQVTFQMGHDAVNLYARYVVQGAGPFRNRGEQWDRLFRSGAGVDLLLGLDAAADPRRQAPVAGDKRIVAALQGDRPVVVLYDAVNPAADPAEQWEAVSPVGRTVFDSVRILEQARLVHAENDSGGYTVELTVPLTAIGLDPDRHRRIRLDWGILETDEQGSTVLQRSYWSNVAASTQADAPSEARLEPHLWGWALLPGHDRTRPAMTNLLDLPKEEIDAEKLLEDW